MPRITLELTPAQIAVLFAQLDPALRPLPRSRSAGGTIREQLFRLHGDNFPAVYTPKHLAGDATALGITRQALFLSLRRMLNDGLAAWHPESGGWTLTDSGEAALSTVNPLSP